MRMSVYLRIQSVDAVLQPDDFRPCIAMPFRQATARPWPRPRMTKASRCGFHGPAACAGRGAAEVVGQRRAGPNRPDPGLWARRPSNEAQSPAAKIRVADASKVRVTRMQPDRSQATPEAARNAGPLTVVAHRAVSTSMIAAVGKDQAAASRDGRGHAADQFDPGVHQRLADCSANGAQARRGWVQGCRKPAPAVTVRRTGGQCQSQFDTGRAAANDGNARTLWETRPPGVAAGQGTVRSV